MSGLATTYLGVVYPWHCDHMGHMNVASYASKFDEATWHLFLRLGLTSTFLREHQRGMVAAEQRTFFKRELCAGDLVVVASAPLEIRPKGLRFVHEMRNAETEELCAVMLSAGVHIDLATRRPSAFPEALAARVGVEVVAHDYDSSGPSC